MHVETHSYRRRVLKRNIALIIEMWQVKVSKDFGRFNDLTLSNQQVWKAENSHPCKNVQVKSDSWCVLIGGSVWWMFRWLRSRAFLFWGLLLSWFHRWRSHCEALCLLKRFEKRKREISLSKVMNINISQHFQCARSLQTSFFVIIVV